MDDVLRAGILQAHEDPSLHYSVKPNMPRGPVTNSTQMYHACNGTHETFTTRHKQTEIDIQCIEEDHERMADS